MAEEISMRSPANELSSQCRTTFAGSNAGIQFTGLARMVLSKHQWIASLVYYGPSNRFRNRISV